MWTWRDKRSESDEGPNGARRSPQIVWCYGDLVSTYIRKKYISDALISIPQLFER
jgi:hypothetical protein